MNYLAPTIFAYGHPRFPPASFGQRDTRHLMEQFLRLIRMGVDFLKQYESPV